MTTSTNASAPKTSLAVQYILGVWLRTLPCKKKCCVSELRKGHSQFSLFSCSTDLCDLVSCGAIDSVRLLPEKNCGFLTFVEDVRSSFLDLFVVCFHVCLCFQDAAMAFHNEVSANPPSINGRPPMIGWGTVKPMRDDVKEAVAEGATRTLFISGKYVSIFPFIVCVLQYVSVFLLKSFSRVSYFSFFIPCYCACFFPSKNCNLSFTSSSFVFGSRCLRSLLPLDLGRSSSFAFALLCTFELGICFTITFFARCCFFLKQLLHFSIDDTNEAWIRQVVFCVDPSNLFFCLLFFFRCFVFCFFLVFSSSSLLVSFICVVFFLLLACVCAFSRWVQNGAGSKPKKKPEHNTKHKHHTPTTFRCLPNSAKLNALILLPTSVLHSSTSLPYRQLSNAFVHCRKTLSGAVSA